MQKYIEQLLQDIEAAKRPEATTNSDDPDLLPDFDTVECFLSGEDNLFLSQYCGMEPSQFPETGKLTETQQQRIVAALRSMYATYGVCFDLPEKLPTGLQYQFLVKGLEKECFVCDWGMVHIDFCDYDPDHCPFGREYCDCLDIWIEAGEEDRNNPRSTWMEMDFVEDCWLTLLANCDASRIALEFSDGPNKIRVFQLLDDICLACDRFQEIDGCFMPHPPEEAPGMDEKQIFEWLELPPISFPPASQLSEPELEALGYALTRLYGKNEMIISLLNLSPEVRYFQLTNFFSLPVWKLEDRFFTYPPACHIQVPDLLGELLGFLEKKQESRKEEDEEEPF